MKVAMICGRMITNGANRIIIEHCLGLQRLGHSARLFALPGESPFPELLPSKKINYYTEGTLAKTLNPLEYDLIVNNTLPGALQTIQAALTAPSIKKRLAFSNSVHFSQNFDPIFLTGANTETCELPHHFFCRHLTCSPVIRDLILQVTDRPIVVVGNGIDYHKFRGYQLSADKIKGERPRIGYMVASGSQTKRVGLALDVFAKLKTKQPDIETVVISSLQLHHQAIDKLLISPDEETKMKTLASLDVFLNTSSLEAFPLTPLEGMALGVPVVATDSYGSRCYANSNNCRLFDTDNPEILAEAILELLRNHPDRCTLSQAGIETAKQHDWDKVMPKVAQVYQALAKGENKIDPFNFKHLKFDQETLQNLCQKNGAPHISRRFEKLNNLRQHPDWQNRKTQQLLTDKDLEVLANSAIVYLLLEPNLTDEAASHAIRSLVGQSYPDLGIIILDPERKFSHLYELSLLNKRNEHLRYLSGNPNQPYSFLLLETIKNTCDHEDTLILVFSGQSYLENEHTVATIITEHLAYELAVTALPGGATGTRDMFFFPHLSKLVPGLFLLSFQKSLIKHVTGKNLCDQNGRWHEGDVVQLLAAILTTIVDPDLIGLVNLPAIQQEKIIQSGRSNLTLKEMSLVTRLKKLTSVNSKPSSPPLFTLPQWREKIERSLMIAWARNDRIIYRRSRITHQENELFQLSLNELRHSSLQSENRFIPPSNSDNPILAQSMLKLLSTGSHNNTLILGSLWLARLASRACRQEPSPPLPKFVFKDKKEVNLFLGYLKGKDKYRDKILHAPVDTFSIDGRQWQWYDLKIIYLIRDIDLLVVPHVNQDDFSNYALKFFFPLGLKSGATILIDTRSNHGRCLPIYNWFAEFPNLTGKPINFEETVWRLKWK